MTKQVLDIIESRAERMTYAENIQYQIRQEILLLKQVICSQCPNNPVLSGFKVYCQTDEDGIIQELLRRIPKQQIDRTLIEIGCGNGLENNTHYLMLRGFRGFWVDGSETNISYLTRALDLANGVRGPLKGIRRFINLENVQATIVEACEFIGSRAPTLLSVDIDGNDLYVLQRTLEICDPEILCIEYNAKFPPPLALAIQYDCKHQWTGDDYQGVSLQMLCNSLPEYTLVTCNLSGANAFFVRNDLRMNFTEYPIEQLYQPLRANLRFLTAGHAPSLKWLRNALDGTSGYEQAAIE